MNSFDELIGIDLNNALALIEKNKIDKYEIFETKSVFSYIGYQYRIVRVQEINGILKLTVSKF